MHYYKCEVCGAVFVEVQNLEEHKRYYHAGNHTLVREYDNPSYYWRCTKCGKTFRHMEDALEHSRKEDHNPTEKVDLKEFNPSRR